MSGEMIEAAGTGDQGLLRRKPTMRSDAVSNLITAFDIWILHIDRANAQLLVTQQTLEMRSHVMLNQITVAFDFADQIRLVPARIEIAMTDLPVVIGADCVIALADMD